MQRGDHSQQNLYKETRKYKEIKMEQTDGSIVFIKKFTNSDVPCNTNKKCNTFPITVQENVVTKV